MATYTRASQHREVSELLHDKYLEAVTIESLYNFNFQQVQEIARLIMEWNHTRGDINGVVMINDGTVSSL